MGGLVFDGHPPDESTDIERQGPGRRWRRDVCSWPDTRFTREEQHLKSVQEQGDEAEVKAMGESGEALRTVSGPGDPDLLGRRF